MLTWVSSPRALKDINGHRHHRRSRLRSRNPSHRPPPPPLRPWHYLFEHIVHGARFLSAPPQGSGSRSQFMGLRISRRPSRVSSASVRATAKVARPGVVCEAQETAIDIPDVTKSTWQSLVLESETAVLVEFWAHGAAPAA
uniref:Uncharacterized protein n=1 Tax=Ananas comosus var. bracteatus TaxID=296719 RepID=A0A6V7PIT2_ANACO|nr:unnamed protein product [Ananas comosus var. bracteatus]